MGLDGIMNYDQNKQDFCFWKVAHLEFTFYSDVISPQRLRYLSKNPFPVKSKIMKSKAAPLQSVLK